MTTWTARTPITTSWNTSRLGGAYLTNSLGEYITTKDGDRIIVLIPGGSEQTNSWTARSTITTSWTPRTTP